ncbi:MAG: hypothetical protein QOD42_1930 [Sphingomonadales bacterium]|jgi:hypothetical protein|nr:hypothetical protein [Sphingomonadales bacterium]
MTIDKEIIFDLLPLCQSGLASEPSRRLVEAWLRDHPEARADSPAGPGAPGGGGIEALARARRLRRWQRWLYGLAIGFTVLAFTSEFQIESGRLVSARLVALELPLLFAPVILAAILCWIGYFRLKRRLR